MIIDLDIQLPESQMEQLMIIIKRNCKLWDGELLLQNVLHLDDFSPNSFPILELVAENLLTLFIFDSDKQQTRINEEFFPNHETIVNFLKVFSKQYKSHTLRFGTDCKDHQQANQKVKFLALPMLMNEVFD